MAPSVQLISFSTFCILILIVFSSTAEAFKTEWFNIISRLKEKCYNLAIDIAPKTIWPTGGAILLILSPWNKTKHSQQWRWNENRLQSRLNGLVWRRENRVSRNVILTAPTSASDQHFTVIFEDAHIYYDIEHYFKNVVVEIFDAQPPTGAPINVFNIDPELVPTQLFDFEAVDD